MAQGSQGRAVPVKWAQEKDQPPAAERSERSQHGEAERSREGQDAADSTWEVGCGRSKGAQKPGKTCLSFN